MQTDASGAVDEVTRDWSGEAPDLIITFVSTKQDAAEIAKSLRDRFPSSHVVGCTTAGEHLNGQHYNGSLVVTGIRAEGLRFVTERIDGLASFDAAAANDLSERLFERLGVEASQVDPRKHFALLFIDGLSMSEERITSQLAQGLQGIPLMGGSAGDDLAFQETLVIHDGDAFSDGAVVVLGEADGGFEVIKHQHFEATNKRLAITKADPASRRVYEMDGYPAIEAYAAALGLKPEDVTADHTFLNPVTFSCDDEIYVRSIQKVEDDGSIVFYCAIEEGMVLEVSSHAAIGDALAEDLEASEPADLLIACNCILRALEADKVGAFEQLGEAVVKRARHSIGFDTYGEQLNGLHINQTLVALAFSDAKEEAR